jgi:hypothetical protein
LKELKASYTKLLKEGVNKRTEIALDELVKGYSTFFLQYTKVKRDSTKADEEAIHHVAMALLAEEQLKIKEYIVANTVGNAGGQLDSCVGNQDGFFADEISGLLLGLGIPSSATEATKIKAMEEERQRLVASGDQDGASEIGGLLKWKLKKTKIVGTCGDVKQHGESGDDGISIENCIGKLRYAVSLHPSSLEANLHLGRLLLTSSREEAFVYIGRELSKDKNSLEAKFLMVCSAVVLMR